MGKTINRLALVLTLLLLPHSARWVIAGRPVGPIYPEFTSHLMYLNETAAGVCVIIWLLRHLTNPTKPLLVTRWWALTPWLLLIGHSLVSALWARASLLALDLTLRWLLAFGLYLYVANEVDDRRWWFWPLVVGAVCQSLLAFFQFMRQGAVGITGLGELGVYLSEPELWVRGYGLSPHPNILAGYLAIALLGIVGAVMISHRAQYVRLLAALAIVTLGLCCTFSRSAALASILGLTLMAVFLVRRRTSGRTSRRRFLLTVLVIVIVSGVFVVATLELFAIRWIEPLKQVLGFDTRIQAIREEENLSERAWYQQAARQMQRAYPLRGIGAGNFTLTLYEMYPNRIDSQVYQPVHNVIHLAAAELGLFGAVWWCALVVIPLALALSTDSTWTVVYGAMSASLFILGVFDCYLWSAPHGRLLFAFVLGLMQIDRSDVPVNILGNQNVTKERLK